MSVKERIDQSLKTMSSDELVIVYDQIKLIQLLKKAPHSKAAKTGIDEILLMTSSSSSSWSDAVSQARSERI